MSGPLPAHWRVVCLSGCPACRIEREREEWLRELYQCSTADFFDQVVEERPPAS